MSDITEATREREERAKGDANMETKKQKHAPGPAEQVSMGLNSIIDNAEHWTWRHTRDHALALSALLDWRTADAALDQNAVLRKIEERLDRWYWLGISAGPSGKDSDFEALKAEVRAAIRKT